jgi:hypothetical protein
MRASRPDLSWSPPERHRIASPYIAIAARTDLSALVGGAYVFVSFSRDKNTRRELSADSTRYSIAPLPGKRRMVGSRRLRRGRLSESRPLSRCSGCVSAEPYRGVGCNGGPEIVNQSAGRLDKSPDAACFH